MEDIAKAPGYLYPGEEASKWDILYLAHEYYNAANTLFSKAAGGPPLPLFPASFCCIHAIELYLNAFLRHEGASPADIRKRMHNLADADFVAKLKLRKRTAAHLAALTERREYLVARYAPEMVAKQSELNRLSATLVEVMMKAGGYLNDQGRSSIAGMASRAV
jgi:hypothetical protein